MRKIIILLVVILSPFLLINSQQETREVKIENKTYRLLIADSPEEHSKGLMDIKKLSNADGMVFIFGDSQVRTFWNQNTLVDLDLYWMQDEKVVGKSFLPSIDTTKAPVTVSSQVPVNQVVEIIRN